MRLLQSILSFISQTCQIHCQKHYGLLFVSFQRLQLVQPVRMISGRDVVDTPLAGTPEKDPFKHYMGYFRLWLTCESASSYNSVRTLVVWGQWSCSGSKTPIQYLRLIEGSFRALSPKPYLEVQRT